MEERRIALLSQRIRFETPVTLLHETRPSTVSCVRRSPADDCLCMPSLEHILLESMTLPPKAFELTEMLLEPYRSRMHDIDDI